MKAAVVPEDADPSRALTRERADRVQRRACIPLLARDSGDLVAPREGLLLAPGAEVP
jgi:hypothetical protein